MNHSQYDEKQGPDKISNPRLPTTQPIELHSDDPDYVSAAIKRIGPALDKICQDNHWHIDALKDRFDPDYFPDASTFSRLINNTAKRRPSAGQLFELRRVAGISLDITHASRGAAGSSNTSPATGARVSNTCATNPVPGDNPRKRGLTSHNTGGSHDLSFKIPVVRDGE